MSPLEAYGVLRISLAVALYAVFGALLWLWWRSTRPSRQTAPRVASAALIVLAPGPTGFASEQSLPVGAVCTLGRAPTADIVLTDEGASLEHAVIHRREGLWWIEDLGSKNGTWLNQQLLDRASPLRAGDMIAIAGVSFRFASTEDGAPAGPS
ncbi:MAG: FHA domain-containing protein [Anaerolineales bacterium]|nr:FHA domain-containing protein [Anaerolineales bacterium]